MRAPASLHGKTNRTRRSSIAIAKKFGATIVINSSDGKAVEHIMKSTGGTGVDVAIEAVGTPATFDIGRRLSGQEAVLPTSAFTVSRCRCSSISSGIGISL